MANRPNQNQNQSFSGQSSGQSNQSQKVSTAPFPTAQKDQFLAQAAEQARTYTKLLMDRQLKGQQLRRKGWKRKPHARVAQAENSTASSQRAQTL